MHIKLEIQLSVRRFLWLSHSHTHSLTQQKDTVRKMRYLMFQSAQYWHQIDDGRQGVVMTTNLSQYTLTNSHTFHESNSTLKSSSFGQLRWPWNTIYRRCNLSVRGKVTHYIRTQAIQSVNDSHHANASDIMFLYCESGTAHLVLKTNSWQEHIQISGAFGESKSCLKYSFKVRSADRSPYTKWC
jgi:hypothetical protein